MSQTACKIIPSSSTLTITRGPHKGQSFSVGENPLTIGRGSNSDIIVQDDPRCSRQHVKISYFNQQFQIENISAKNHVLVNNEPAQKKILKNEDRILIGNTELQFSLKMAYAKVAPNISEVPPPRQQPQAKRQGEIPQKNNTRGGRLRFYAIIGVIALFVFYLILEDKNKKNDPNKLELRTSEQVQMDLEESIQNKKNYTNQLQDQEKDTSQYRSSQTYYLKGFRDYRQGHYKMAMQEFSAALSVFPKHLLAKKYYALARRKFNELIQFNMIQGRRYKSKHNYRLCKSAFISVLRMSNKPNEPIYKEAKTLFDECNKLSEGRY